jgi:hypothetical protein
VTFQYILRYLLSKLGSLVPHLLVPPLCLEPSGSYAPVSHKTRQVVWPPVRLCSRTPEHFSLSNCADCPQWEDWLKWFLAALLLSEILGLLTWITGSQRPDLCSSLGHGGAWRHRCWVTLLSSALALAELLAVFTPITLLLELTKFMDSLSFSTWSSPETSLHHSLATTGLITMDRNPVTSPKRNRLCTSCLSPAEDLNEFDTVLCYRKKSRNRLQDTVPCPPEGQQPWAESATQSHLCSWRVPCLLPLLSPSSRAPCLLCLLVGLCGFAPVCLSVHWTCSCVFVCTCMFMHGLVCSHTCARMQLGKPSTISGVLTLTLVNELLFRNTRVFRGTSWTHMSPSQKKEPALFSWIQAAMADVSIE